MNRVPVSASLTKAADGAIVAQTLDDLIQAIRIAPDNHTIEVPNETLMERGKFAASTDRMNRPDITFRQSLQPLFAGKARSLDEAIILAEDVLGERVGGSWGGVHGTHLFKNHASELTFRWTEDAQFAKTDGTPEIKLPSGFVFEEKAPSK